MQRIEANDVQVNSFTRFGSDFCLVSAYREDGSSNALTAAWGTLGTYWNLPVATVLIRPHRYTREFLDASVRFAISFFPKDREDALWFIGSHSGRDMPDKIERAGFHRTDIDGVPGFAEATLLLACRKVYVAPLDQSAFLDPSIEQIRYPKGDFSLQYIGAIESAWKAEAYD